MFFGARNMRSPEGEGAGSAPTGESGNADQQFAQEWQKLQEEARGAGERATRAEREAQSSRETLEKLKQALGHEKQPENKLGWYDKVLETATEAHMRGQGMPITVEIATQVAEMQKVLEELNKENARLKEETKRNAHPEVSADNLAYTNIDSLMRTMIDQYYGKTQDGAPMAPQSVYTAVVNSMRDKITTLQNESPRQWQLVRGNVQAQQQLVNSAIREILPPKAVEMLQEQYEEAQPLTAIDFQKAIQEAKAIKDPLKRGEVLREVREKLWEWKWNRDHQGGRR